MNGILSSISNLLRGGEARATIGGLTPRIQVDLAEVPKYPPYHPGLPAVTPDQIADSQDELIDRVRGAVAVSNEDFDRTYLAAIKNYAAFVHLLPASESHHHRGTGGLFRHGLEAALYGAMHADRLMFVMDEPPSRRRVLEPIWRFAAFLAALNHDIGKPLSDMAVQDQSGAITWNPFIGSLHQWAEQNRIDYYHIRFRPGRHQDHETIGMLALEQVITPQLKQYLIEAGPKLLRWMVTAIANAQEAESINPFRDLVIRADRDSVERDLRINGAMQSNMPSIGVAAERFVLDAMRRLVRNKKWKVNLKGARVWIIDGNLYVAWNAARDIVRVIAEDNTPGVPRDPDSIADMLIERDLAVPRKSFHGPRRYWTIAPEALKGITLKSLRLSSPDLLLDPSPGSVAGEVLADDEDTSTSETVSNPPVEQESPRHEREPTNTESIKNKPAAENKPEAKQVFGDKSELDAKPNTSPSEQSRSINYKSEKPTSSEEKKPSPQPVTAATRAIDNPFKGKGIVTEIISTLIDEIQTGKRPQEIVRQESGLVVMAWPDAFEGFGMEPRIVLTEMAGAGLVEPDPSMPTRMVRDDAEGNKIVAIKHHEGTALLAMVREERPKQPPSGVTADEKTVSTESVAKKTPKARPGKTQPEAKKAISTPPAPEQDGDIIDRFVTYFLEPGVSPPFPVVQINGGVSLPFNLAAAYFARENDRKPKVIKNQLLAEDERSNSRISLTTVRKSLRIEIRSASTEGQTG
ncbi:MAG: MobH family relaxase [Candidatus Thiodiazotropha sp. (ex. Lucinoma kazani)]